MSETMLLGRAKNIEKILIAEFLMTFYHTFFLGTGASEMDVCRSVTRSYVL